MFEGMKQWWAEPYKPEMSVAKWFLFVGMIVLLLAVWKVIVWHLQEAM